MRLDKTKHQAYHFKNQPSERENHQHLSSLELVEVFNYLQSVAYNFKLNCYPKMDKTIHSFRKNG